MGDDISLELFSREPFPPPNELVISGVDISQLSLIRGGDILDKPLRLQY